MPSRSRLVLCGEQGTDAVPSGAEPADQHLTVVDEVAPRPRLLGRDHYGEQHGDLMRDPEIVFEVAAGNWHPVRIQPDYIDSYREAVSIGEDGRLYVRLAEVH